MPSLKDPRLSETTVNDFFYFSELLPKSSVVVVDLKELKENGAITKLESAMRKARVLGPEELNAEEVCLMLVNWENGKKGLFLTSKKPRNETSIGLPDFPLDGKYPYVGLCGQEETNTKYCISVGNDMSVPYSKDSSEMNRSERELINLMLENIGHSAPQHMEGIFTVFEPTISLVEVVD